MKGQETPTRIIIERRNGIKQMILLISLVFLVGVLEYTTSKAILAVVLLLVPILVPIFQEYQQHETYLSEIIIDMQLIHLIYKRRNTTISTREFSKTDVKRFHVEVYIPKDLSSAANNSTITIEIDIQNAEPIIYKFTSCPNQTSLRDLFFSPWKPAINFVKNHEKIPNFSYQVHGSEYVKSEIEQYFRYKKGFSFFEQLKVQYRTGTSLEKFKVIFGVSATLIPLGMFVFFVVYLCLICR